MYEMLTGRPPFTGQPFQVITKVRSRPPVPPRQRRDSIDPGLEAICMKCLEKTVERRYQSMGNLAEDLQRFMSGAEVSALREVSPAEHLDCAGRSVGRCREDGIPHEESDHEARSIATKTWWQFWR